jgi:hypothetical protein
VPVSIGLGLAADPVEPPNRLPKTLPMLGRPKDGVAAGSVGAAASAGVAGAATASVVVVSNRPPRMPVPLFDFARGCAGDDPDADGDEAAATVEPAVAAGPPWSVSPAA